MSNYQKEIIEFCKAGLLQTLLFMASVIPISCRANNIYKDSSLSLSGKQSISLHSHFQIFYPLQNTAEYSIKLCADLPVNDNPGCIYKKGEPGHVFLILSKKNLLTNQVLTRSFGFYPRFPVTIFFKKGKSRILDNSNREYNASVEKELTRDEFEFVLEKCIEHSNKKYNLKKYNCYDYALKVFNDLPGIEKLPINNVRFPFVFGRGGSPCGLYKDLEMLVKKGSAWTSFIKFGFFKSPDDKQFQNLFAAY